LLRIR